MTKTSRSLRRLATLSALLASAGLAQATNGYFPHGYGMKAKGMGGASTAMAADSLGGATNPAGMVWVGTRVDLGVDLFMPRREASAAAPALRRSTARSRATTTASSSPSSASTAPSATAWRWASRSTATAA